MFSEIFALFSDCINIFREGSDLLCKRCECVVGRIEEDSARGIFVKLHNFRLVENQPLRPKIDAEISPRQNMFSRTTEVPNHLKRKAETTKSDMLPRKFSRPNDNEICLMNAFLPSINFPDFNTPDFDSFDSLSDISDVGIFPDISLDDLMPFLLAPIDPYPLTASNDDDIVALSPPPIDDSPLIVIDDDEDSDVEFISNSPPNFNIESRPFTPANSVFNDFNLNAFSGFMTPPPPYSPGSVVEDPQINFTRDEVDLIYRALILLMTALGFRAD